MSLSESMPAMTMPVVPAGSVGYNSGNGLGGDSAWIIILFLIFAMMNNDGNGLFGNRRGGGSGGGAAGGYVLTSDFSNIERKIDGVNNGLCDGFYALNTGMLNGFHGIDNAICNLGYTMQGGFNATQVAMMQGQNAIQTQLAQCCCDNRTGQMQIGNQIERAACDTNYNAATNTTAIITNAHNDTDRVLARLDAMEMSRKDETIAALRSQVDALNLAQSQANQNNYLVNTLRPCPTPAYITCNPWGGQAAYGSCGSCGC